MSAAAASFRIELLYPSPHALLRVVGRVGSEAAGVGGCSVIRALDNAPPPTPPHHSLRSWGEGRITPPSWTAHAPNRAPACRDRRQAPAPRASAARACSRARH